MGGGSGGIFTEFFRYRRREVGLGGQRVGEMRMGQGMEQPGGADGAKQGGVGRGELGRRRCGHGKLAEGGQGCEELRQDGPCPGR